MTNRFKCSLAIALAAVAFVMTPPTVAGQAGSYTPPKLPNGQPDLQGIWQVVNNAHYNIEDHEPSLNVPGGYGIVEGGTLPYKPEALKKRDENFKNRATIDPETFCYLPGVPRMTYMPFPFQIVQFSDLVAISYEYLGTTRQLFLTGKHPDPEVYDYWMGDSRARWEGNTLVVDVGNHNANTWFDRAGNYHSDLLHVVERYTRTGPDTMMYEVTVTDPTVFTRPWKMSMPLYRRQEKDLRLLEYECYAYMEEEASKGNVKLPWSELQFEGVPKQPAPRAVPPKP